MIDLSAVAAKADTQIGQFLDVRYLLTGAACWIAKGIWDGIKTAQKLKVTFERTVGQVDATVKAIEDLRRNLDDATSRISVVDNTVIRLSKDIDAAHDAIRSVRGCPSGKSGNPAGPE